MKISDAPAVKQLTARAPPGGPWSVIEGPRDDAEAVMLDVAPELRLSGSRSRFWPPVHFGGERKSERRAMVPPLVVSGRTAAPAVPAYALRAVRAS